jgi:prophage antirepressor-like protein
VVEEEISDQPGLIPFAYGSQKVRVKWIDNEPWFMLSDVCRAIGYGSPHKAVALIREDDRKTLPVIDSLGRAQDAMFISERGMSQFFLRARVPAVEPFQDWVFDEVLPSIRKTGQYQAQPQLELNNPLSHLAAIGQAFQTIAQQMQIQEQKIANLEQAAQQVKYLEIAKTDRSEVLEILHSELVEQKAKDRIEQLNHYRQRKELEKRVSDVAWLAVKAHGGDHGDIIKETNKRIKMAIRGAHGYAIGRERYQDQDFIMAYQVVAMIEKEIGDFPSQGKIDFDSKQ